MNLWESLFGGGSDEKSASSPRIGVNPATGNPILDLVPEAERQDAKRGRHPLEPDNEEYANALFNLLADYSSQAESEKDRRDAAMIAIGAELDQAGGFTRMRLVCLRVKALGGNARILESRWDGIGDWLG